VVTTTLALAGCGQGLPETAPPAATVEPPPVSSGSLPATTGEPAATSVPVPPQGDPVATGTPDDRWEKDAAVKALRLHYLGSAKAVNAGSTDIPELRKSSTAERFSRLESIWSSEYGYRYPGPIPFTPLAVTAESTTTRVVTLCVLAKGWLRNPNTGRPAEPRQVERGTARVVKEDGSWRVDSIRGADGSCDGVPIEEVRF
jgi:hypothetical protein